MVCDVNALTTRSWAAATSVHISDFIFQRLILLCTIPLEWLLLSSSIDLNVVAVGWWVVVVMFHVRDEELSSLTESDTNSHVPLSTT